MSPRILLAVLWILVICPGAVHAQVGNSLRGRVRDENDRPVSFVQVQVVPGDRRVVADQNGEFVIAGIEEREAVLRFRRIGYEPTQVTVRFPFSEPVLIITMTSLPRVLDSVRIRERGPVATFTGVVIDDADQPVIGAEVIAAGASDLNVRTDSSGHFRLLKAQKGTLVLRVRRFGYTPYFGSLSLQSEREDTIRVKRLAQDLPEAYIRVESGFGRDTFAYIELDSRMRWKLSTGGVVSREDLDRYADLDLCKAVMRTTLGGKMELRESGCSLPRCILIDGLEPLIRPLNAFLAAEVEAFEFHRKDWSGTLASRIKNSCARAGVADQGGIVVWMRRRR